MPASLAMLIVLLGASRPAAAQPPRARGDRIATVVLRSTDGISFAVADAVDSALIHALESTAGLPDPAVSPIELEEIQLTAGCRANTRECFRTIARTIRADSLVVRELALASDGNARLRLAFYDSATDAPSAVERSFDPGSARAGARAVEPAIRELFHIPAPVVARVVPDDGGIGAHTWITLGAAGVLLAGGTVMGVLAAAAHDDYLGTPVDTTADADRAAERLQTAQDRSLAANVLFGVGAAAAIAGAALLAIDLDLLGPSSEAIVAPVAGGGVVAVRGELEAP